MKPAWTIEYTDAAKKDRDALNLSVRKQVYKALRKVSKNPLPKSEGGYGNPLGNKQSTNLAGFLKIKLLKLGIRIVYKLQREDRIMSIVTIAARADDEVYEIAAKRKDV